LKDIDPGQHLSSPFAQSACCQENLMSKCILVPATGSETDALVFTVAVAIARRSAGHVKFLHIRPDVRAIVAAMAASDLGGRGTGYDEIFGSLETNVAGRQKRAETAFREVCEREQIAVSNEARSGTPSAEWTVATGNGGTHMTKHGRVADLIVLGHARKREPMARDVLEASLMQTGRPVLIVPPTMPDRATGTIVIAWKDTAEAARAVAAAQPFIELADRVIILTIEEDGEPDALSSERLRQALIWHNPNTTVQSLRAGLRSCIGTFLAAATAVDAELLVMGGYGHSRMREMIFGGFTRRVLSGAPMCLFSSRIDPGMRTPPDFATQCFRYLTVIAFAICAILMATAARADHTPDGAAILVYHRFGPTASSTTVSDAALDDQLAWLASHVRVAPLRLVIEALRSGSPAAERPCVAITADDGHQSIYTDLYPRICRYRLPVTLFIYPSAISNAPYALTWAELSEMVASGLVSVQSHTYWHPNFHQEKARRSPADYRDFVDTQLVHSKQRLETQLGRPVDMLAWPFGIYDDELGGAARRAGYIAGFILGDRIAVPGANPLALPRLWMSDSDRASRLAAMLATACPPETGQSR
jgi:nucleotide-binding universal stress UspA family protein/peptidoglycan/xylan/chitin deacetylase (PgdA/CDA1 family)